MRGAGHDGEEYHGRVRLMLSFFPWPHSHNGVVVWG